MIAPLYRMTRYFTVISVCFLVACASGTSTVKKQSVQDFSSSATIELQITGNDSAVESKQLQETVRKNLADWRYPITAQTDGKTATHRLIATLGRVENAQTPTGLSFSMGNSDPRALGFQKTDVQPIRCQLTSVAHPDQGDEYSQSFSGSTTGKQGTEKLADYISTACFNLLREVKWPLPVQANKPEVQKSSWMPQVQIETREVPAVSVKTPEKPAAEVKNVDVKNADVKKAETVTVETKPAEVENSGNADEPRKQVIIHNLGSPIIFEMGHQRR
jgi:hypothetical protein